MPRVLVSSVSEGMTSVLMTPAQRASRWLLSLLMVASLFACSSKESANPDPRAYPGADSDVTLETALGDHGLKLPGAASDVHFGAFSGREYSFQLSFDIACSSVPGFLTASSFTAPLRTGVVPSLVYSAGLSRGWDVERFGSPRGIEEDIRGVLHRSVLVVDLTAPNCRVFVASFK
jgi:hypothetical protein